MRWMTAWTVTTVGALALVGCGSDDGGSGDATVSSSVGPLVTFADSSAGEDPVPTAAATASPAPGSLAEDGTAGATTSSPDETGPVETGAASSITPDSSDTPGDGSSDAEMIDVLLELRAREVPTLPFEVGELAARWDFVAEILEPALPCEEAEEGECLARLTGAWQRFELLSGEGLGLWVSPGFLTEGLTLDLVSYDETGTEPVAIMLFGDPDNLTAFFAPTLLTDSTADLQGDPSLSNDASEEILAIMDPSSEGENLSGSWDIGATTFEIERNSGASDDIVLGMLTHEDMNDTTRVLLREAWLRWQLGEG